MSDKQFVNTLKMIVGVLVGSTVAVLAFANALISDADYSRSTIIQEDIEDRIKPVGSVHVVNGAKVAGNTSGAPAPNARRVTPARLSDSLKVLEICCKEGLRNSSALTPRQVKVRTNMKIPSG